MGRAKVDVVLIVPGQGRWVYTRALYCVEFFPFAECRRHFRQEWGKSDEKNTRKHAIREALRLELKRQKGELRTEPMN